MLSFIRQQLMEWRQNLWWKLIACSNEGGEDVQDNEEEAKVNKGSEMKIVWVIVTVTMEL